MSDPKFEYIESLHQMHEANELLLKGAALVVEGGVEGIKKAVEEQPELVLHVIAALVKLADQQHQSHLRLAEDYLELADVLDTLTDK